MSSRYLLRFETGERRGEEIPIEGPRVRLGRRAVNEVRILDASISGEHAELLLGNGQIELADCGSTNGTRFAGQRIERRVIQVGDVFALGNVKLRILAADAAGSAPPLEDEDLGGDGGDFAFEDADEPLIEGLDDGAPPVPATAAPGSKATPKAPKQTAGSSELPPEALPASMRPGSVVPAELAHTAVIGAEEVGEGVGQISRDAVELSGKRSALTWIVLVAVLAGGGFLAWQRFGGPVAVEGRVVEVPVIAGNLLTHGAFEAAGGADEGSTWEPFGEPAAALVADELWRRTGSFGLGAELIAGEWSAAGSESVRVRSRRPVRAQAWLSVEGDAGARLGLLLESSAGRAEPIEVWGPVVRATAGFEDHELALEVPAAFDRARVLIGAGVKAAGDSASQGSAADSEEDAFGPSGLVSVDDVALVQDSAEAPAPTAYEEFQFVGAGAPSTRAFLTHVDRVLLADMRVLRTGAGRAAFFAQEAHGTLAATQTGTGMRVAVSGAPQGAVLAMRVDAELASGGVATTGPDGYRAHTLGFDEPRAGSILLGTGLSLVRLVFESPVPVTGHPVQNGYELEIDASALGQFEVQLAFANDRDQALQLARAARDAEAADQLGMSMAHWGDLLNTYPFEAALVREAEESRARLLAAGVEELQDLRRELERSSFFGLSELTRRYRQRAQAIAERFEGSEVEASARELAQQMDGQLSELESGAASARRQRLASIAQYLVSDAPELAAHVQSALNGDMTEDEGR